MCGYSIGAKLCGYSIGAKLCGYSIGAKLCGHSIGAKLVGTALELLKVLVIKVHGTVSDTYCFLVVYVREFMTEQFLPQ